MQIIDSSYKILRFDPVKDIETICIGYCTCYNTPIPKTYHEQCEFVKKHLHHESPLEHSSMSVLFTINRAISHELVRHRHTAYSQESTRYCNYSNNRFGNELTFIEDNIVTDDQDDRVKWLIGLECAETLYLDRINSGLKPDVARGLLPNDLATKLLVTTNYREWRSIFKLRCDKHAHYQMREIMNPLLKEVSRQLPCVFGDLVTEED